MTEETHDPDDLGFELPQPGRTSRARVLVVIGVLAAAAFGFGYLKHRSAAGAVPVADGSSGGGARPARVEVMQPKLLGSDRDLLLPGTVRPLEQTAVYPRVT